MSTMTYSIFTLDPNYSTTRLVSTIRPQIEDPPEAKFKTLLFLPEGEGRQGEGGLRTKIKRRLQTIKTQGPRLVSGREQTVWEEPATYGQAVENNMLFDWNLESEKANYING